MTDDHSNPSCPIKLAHGTTTLAFRFQGGIVCRQLPVRLTQLVAVRLTLYLLDRRDGFESYRWKLDRQSDSEEGHSRVAVESG